MAKPIQLVDQYGQPLKREVLTQERAGPTLSGVRSVITGYPGDGMRPNRLAAILREADSGQAMRYLELAEQMEEKDLHYAGVLGTRKRNVAQIEITVEAASDAPEHVAHADMLRDWLKRDELQDEIFHILDAIGKGFSLTEIIWDTSEGDWTIARLEWRDPRWFTFDRIDGRTPLLRTDEGYVPLDPYKYVRATIQAKSGLPIRSGIARLACWAWMMKNYTQRDWAIFTQTYGQPIRIGKYGPGASGDDKDILFQAVANIAGDCAAIIPADMVIEFIESKSAAANVDIYLRRADWLDQQVSKAVLGQTATTDAIAGGHAVGQEHRKVQEDIERADAKATAAILNRDIARPWVDLQYGPQKVYPRIRIGRPDEKDVTAVTDALVKLVPFGLRVQKSDVSDMLGFADPDPGADVLTPPAPPPAPLLPGQLPPGGTPSQPGLPPALQAAQLPVARDAIDASIEAMLAGEGWEPLLAPMLAGLGDKLAGAGTQAEAEQILAAHLAGMDISALGETLARASFAARLAGGTGQTLTGN